jgi:hypothetical protein
MQPRPRESAFLLPVLDAHGSQGGESHAMADPAEPNNTRTMVILLAVVGVGAVVAFALLQTPPPPPAPPVAVAAATPAPFLPPASFPAAAPVTAVAAAPAAVVPPDAAPAWENTIDGILRSNVTEGQMARMLINILPTLPEDGQIEAANHIANLLPDADYNSVRPLLLNSSLPESVLSVFFTDLMNRDDPTKLSAFLDIAQIPNHPFQSEALSDLQIYVGEDYGNDWSKWKTAVGHYLKTANEQ